MNKPDIETIIYNQLDEWYPGEPEIRECCCKALKGCKDLTCPKLKLAMARVLAKKIREANNE